MTNEAPTTCAHCGRTLSGYIEVTRFTPTGQSRESVRVCALVCLLQWSYRQVIERSARGVVQAKSLLQQLAEMIRGPRG